MPLAPEKITKLIHADRHWRNDRIVLGKEWDDVTEMQVFGNASNPVPHTKLPKAILAWLDADVKRSILFRRSTDPIPEEFANIGYRADRPLKCNVQNIDLPARATIEGGHKVVFTDFAAIQAAKDAEIATEKATREADLDKAITELVKTPGNESVIATLTEEKENL